jgi:hypothetical protein
MCLPIRERPKKGTPADAAVIRDSHRTIEENESIHDIETAPVVEDVMATGERKDRVWDAAAGRDPDREALDIEAAIAAALARNTRLTPPHQSYGRA